MVRDLNPEIIAAIDCRARLMKLSRQQFLHEHLHRVFGPNEMNVTASIAARLRQVFESVPKSSYSVSRVAMELGMPDATLLEANLSGEQPLAFTTARKLCDLLGVDPEWLLEGKRTPFHQMPRFRNADDCLAMLARKELRSQGGAPYSSWYFLLSDEPNGRAAVYGYASETPWRLDLLLSDVPVTDNVGAGGSQQLFVFGLLCTTLEPKSRHSRLLETGFDTWGRVLNRQRFYDVVGGQEHPGLVTREEAGHVPWAEDLADMEYKSRPYSESFLLGRDTFRLIANERGITTNTELTEYTKKTIAQMFTRNGAQAPAQTLKAPNHTF